VDPTRFLRRGAAGACVSLALCMAADPALAQHGWMALFEGTPAQYFNEEDQRLFQEAFDQALDRTPAQEKVTWENPATRSRGELTVASEFTWQTYNCRRLVVVNEAKERKGKRDVNMCKVEDRWRLVTPSQLGK
jgi:surface antigen